MFKIRPFDHSGDDYEVMAAIAGAVWTDQPASAAYNRRVDEQRPPEHMLQRAIAEWWETEREPGQGVAFAEWGHMPWAFDAHRFNFTILVYPGYQRRGIGGALYGWVEQTLAAHNPTVLESATREDQPAGKRFLEHRGFRVGSRLPSSELDPAAFEVSRFETTVARVQESGIVLRTLRELAHDPERLRKIYDVHVEAEQDVPWHGEMRSLPFEQWVVSYQDNPDLLEDGYIVALDGSRYVGVSYLWGSEATDEILYTGFTGVRRAYRRRGIATAMKVRAIQYARSRETARGGPPVIRTGNEESNPMLELNLSLGFKEIPAWLAYVKELQQGH